MKIYKVTDPEFVPYGRVVEGVDFGPLVDKMQETPLPDGVAYEPSVDTLEALPVMKATDTTNCLTQSSITETVRLM